MKKEKKKNKVRYDKNHIRLKTGESQNENGTYVYRWTDKFGKRRATYAPTLDELRKKEEQLQVDNNEGIRFEMQTKTVNELFDLWMQLKKGIKDSTFKNYIYMYEMFVAPNFGKRRISQVKKSDVRRFYNQLFCDKALKISTIDGIHNVLHQVFQVAVDDDMIRRNPTDGMLRELKLAYSSEKSKREALTVEQQKLFFNYMQKNNMYRHWHPVFYIMVNTGMRVGEITGLRWSDVDFEQGIISINHTLVYYNHRDEKGCYYSINTPKTKAGEREIPMTDAVKEAFLAQKKYLEDACLSCNVSIDGYTDFIFINKDGGVQNQGTLNKAIKRITRDCNMEILDNNKAGEDVVLIPDFSCHILRHTFATRLCENGIMPKAIQSILGHADITTTMNIYVSITNDIKKRELETFEQYKMSEGLI